MGSRNTIRNENLDVGEIISSYLDFLYPTTNLGDSLKAWQCVIICILAAQTNYKNVAKIQSEIFQNTLKELANMNYETLYEYVKHIRFGKVKTQRVLDAAKEMLKYGGDIPITRNFLESLPGIGRKSAAVILSQYSSIPALAVDTHVIRICNRLHISTSRDAKQVETSMMKVFKSECWSRIHTQLMYFGQEICTSRDPACEKCKLTDLCNYYKENYNG